MRLGHRFEILFLFVLLTAFSTANVIYCASETVEIGSSLSVTGTETAEYSNQNVVIKGNIRVNQNASLRFNGCNITIQWLPGTGGPHIQVTENGYLALENCSLLLRLDLIPGYSTSGKIIVQDEGIFRVQDSSITCTSDIVLWCRGSSEVTFVNANYSGRASESGLHWGLEDMLPEYILREYFDDYTINCEETANLKILNSRAGRLSVIDDAICTINGSKISLLIPYSSEPTQTHDSQVRVLMITQRDKELRLTGSISGFYSMWSSSEYFGPGSDIILTDTRIDHVWLSLVNCTSEIEDADLWLLSMYQGEVSMRNSDAWVMRASYGNATIQDSTISYLVAERVDGDLQVEDCDIGWLGLTAFSRETQYHKIQANIENTTIESCAVNYWIVPFEVDVSFRDVVFGNLSMRPAPIYEAAFDKCRVTDTITLYAMNAPEYSLNVRGSLDLLGVSLEEYPNTLMIREYEVRVMQDDTPVMGAEVQLIRDNVVWMSGQTDIDGSFIFQLSWVDRTEPDTRGVPLETPVNNITSSIIVRVDGASKRISALSTTPIIIETHSKQKYMLQVVFSIVVVIFVYGYFIIRKGRKLS